MQTAPDPEIIRKLEELLERARAGEFSAISFAAQNVNGNTSSLWHLGDGGHFSTLLGAIEQSKHRLLNESAEA